MELQVEAVGGNAPRDCARAAKRVLSWDESAVGGDVMVERGCRYG
jgi:hypothetical protein